MDNAKLIKEIRQFQKEYEASFPANVQVDDDDDTFGGAAYNLLWRALQALEETTGVNCIYNHDHQKEDCTPKN